MIIDTFANRLKKAIELRNIKQVELAQKTQIDKSLISNYLKGKYEAKQTNLYVLADALDVNPTWLMGYDVSLERAPDNQRTNSTVFQYIAEDDAMYPLLDVGDIALIYKQDFIEDKATLLFILDNKATIRKFILSEDKNYYKLIASNNYYKDIIININEITRIKILGKVIEAQNKSAFK